MAVSYIPVGHEQESNSHTLHPITDMSRRWRSKQTYQG